MALLDLLPKLLPSRIGVSVWNCGNFAGFFTFVCADVANMHVRQRL
jgi:hypothetical protein